MPLIDRPRHQVLIGDRDVTERCDTITYSATDNGGFEIATLGLPASDRPKKGTQITIRQGLEVAWFGRVAEIADHSQHGRATRTTGCEGYRALMRDTAYSMVYVDRDLTQWGPPSTTRQIALLTANDSLQQSQTSSDAASGNPAIVQTISDSWTAPFIPLCESWYDAGPDNLVAYLYYYYVASNTGGGWTDRLFSAADANLTGGPVAAIANLATGSPQEGLFGLGIPCRYLLAQHFNGTTPAGQQGATYSTYWQNLAAYGNHGVPGRGPSPFGFWPSDIARHALSQCSGISAGTIINSTGFIVPHLVYRTATAADVIVDDMAKLMGWPWGVWEPSTILGSQPRLDFRPPPTDATAVVSKAECDELDVTSRLGDLYNVCEVTYTDPAAGIGVATVTLPNAQLIEAGITDRTLLLNMGPGTLASATAFANFALELSQISARAAGQATLPVSVRLPYGGSKPACLLRPGIDRLRIIDLVDGGPLLDIGTVRRDVFRISRVETSVARDGSVSTRVELDNGPNLLEVLQARLQTDVGLGASGG